MELVCVMIGFFLLLSSGLRWAAVMARFITIQRLLSPFNETYFFSKIYISTVILQILLLVLFNIIVLQSQISIQSLNVHDMEYANKK